MSCLFSQLGSVEGIKTLIELEISILGLPCLAFGAEIGVFSLSLPQQMMCNCIVLFFFLPLTSTF